MDCVCTPSQVNYVPGKGANYSVVKGVDSEGVGYVGMIMSQVIPNTGGERTHSMFSKYLQTPMNS